VQRRSHANWTSWAAAEEASRARWEEAAAARDAGAPPAYFFDKLWLPDKGAFLDAPPLSELLAYALPASLPAARPPPAQPPLHSFWLVPVELVPKGNMPAWALGGRAAVVCQVLEHDEDSLLMRVFVRGCELPAHHWPLDEQPGEAEVLSTCFTFSLAASEPLGGCEVLPPGSLAPPPGSFLPIFVCNFSWSGEAGLLPPPRPWRSCPTAPHPEPQLQPLAALDIFGGVGSFCVGNAAWSTRYLLENDPAAAATARLNLNRDPAKPRCVVLEGHAGIGAAAVLMSLGVPGEQLVVSKGVLDAVERLRRAGLLSTLPKIGELGVITGGPPCQARLYDTSRSAPHSSLACRMQLA